MKKILIIEDEPLHLKALEDYLQKSGFQTIGADNGEKGLALAKKEKPFLIILDLLLPKMSGITVLEQLRKDPTTSSTPVVVLTALGDDSYRNQATNLGVREYFVKTGWKLTDLIKKITEIAREIANNEQT